jgi:hypothetical protein
VAVAIKQLYDDTQKTLIIIAAAATACFTTIVFAKYHGSSGNYCKVVRTMQDCEARGGGNL